MIMSKCKRLTLVHSHWYIDKIHSHTYDYDDLDRDQHKMLHFEDYG